MIVIVAHTIQACTVLNMDMITIMVTRHTMCIFLNFDIGNF